MHGISTQSTMSGWNSVSLLYFWGTKIKWDQEILGNNLIIILAVAQIDRFKTDLRYHIDDKISKQQLFL